MKKILMTAAAIVATLAMTGSAQAGPGGKGGSGGGGGGFKGGSSGGFKGGSSGGFKGIGGGFKPTHVSNHGPFKGHTPFKPTHVSNHGPFKGHGLAHGKFDYHHKFGKSFSHGFCYHGKHHCHWTYSCWSPKYGCNAYWCPSACCYYYWCEPACCYYPISYISVAPPVQVAVVQSPTPAPVQVAGPVGGPPAGIPPLPE